jgi:hypothetical protein
MTDPSPVTVERLDLEGYEDQRIMMETFGRLAMGVQTFSQWAPVFANPELFHLPGLRCKAFTVWFPTMIDFVGEAVPQIWQLGEEAHQRGLDDHGLLDLARTVERYTRDLLSLFTKEEQLYLYDRRLQNAHGLVSQFYRPMLGVRWFNAEDGIVYRQKIIDEEYLSIMKLFYPTMQQSTLALVDRCIGSDEWTRLAELVQNGASMASLMALAAKLGVLGGVVTG